VLNEAEITTAVDLHRRAYQLLRWLEQAIRDGKILFDQAHEVTSVAEAARQWVERHYFTLPPRCRPNDPSGSQLEQFANLVASYLTASFDLIEEPGKRKASDCGCWCPFCTYLVSLPHLRPKKLTQADKQRARELIHECLGRLAHEQGHPLESDAIEELLEDSALREKAAMVAYGDQLLKRMHGDLTDPSTLALWRIFAWEPAGSPKHGFQLSASEIVRAERTLAAIMR
jgi:hypothetical protein